MGTECNGSVAGGRGVEFRVLGSFEVCRAGHAIALGGPRQRAVLAALTIRANHLVPTDELALAVWERPPASAASNVRTYVTALRRILVDNGVGARLWTGPNGYRLIIGAGELDLTTFTDLAERADSAYEQGRLVEAVALYRRARSIWRGPALAGQHLGGTFSGKLARLEERRQVVIERCLEAQIGLGGHRDLIGELRELVARYPYRESLWALLMVALHESGRRADALGVYREARELLVNDLGIEPGEHLQRVHSRVLAAAPATLTQRWAPAELPAPVTEFVGRRDELERLDRLLEQAGDTMVVVAIGGMPGVGKTALAVHWAHRVIDRFPDGQLFVDLGGLSAGPPAKALARLLRSLGLPDERIPSEVDDQVALYRSVLAGRRVLIVLDDAGSSDQVRPLLPGQSGCLVVVTSRNRLACLVARDAARPLTLDVLCLEESLSLLAQALGDQRVAGERDAAASLVRLCGGLPLALRMVAARLTYEPRRQIEHEVAHLRRGNRLAALQPPGDTQSVLLLAIERSYDGLSEPARTLLRLMATHPGDDLSSDAAAALTATTVERAETVLDELVGASVAGRTPGGRYRQHDLLRQYGRTLCDATESRAATRRLLGWYLSTLDLASRLLDPYRRRSFDLDPPKVDLPAFAGRDDALAWCEAELANLVAAVADAARRRMDSFAWRIPVALFAFLELRRRWPEWLETHKIGLTCARRLGARHGEAWLLNSLGTAHKQAGRIDRALDCYEHALEIRRELGDRNGAAATLTNLGALSNVLDRWDDAVQYHKRALTMFRETGDRWGEGVVLTNLGEVYRSRRWVERAHACFVRAGAIHEALDDVRGHAVILHNLGLLDRAIGRPAAEHLSLALKLFEELGDEQATAVRNELSTHEPSVLRE